MLNCASEDAASEYMFILDHLSNDTCYQQASQQAKSLASRRYSYEKWLAELRTLFLQQKTSRDLAQELKDGAA